jgi:hypothetical protein
VDLALRQRGLQWVGHIIAAVAAVVAVATVAGALTLRLGGIGVGHDDRLKDVPCLSLVLSVDRDSYLELFVHFLEVFLQCYGRSEYARGNRSEKIGRSDQWCPSLTRALTRRNFFNVGLLATARAYLSVSETRAETNVTGRAGVP